MTVDVSNEQSNVVLVSSPSPSLLREVERVTRCWGLNVEGTNGVGSKTKGIFA